MSVSGSKTNTWSIPNHRRLKFDNRKESFAYDALDRLAGATVNQVDASGTVTGTVSDLTYAYDGSIGSGTTGDLIQRTDIGKFNYSQGHAPSDAFGDIPVTTAPEAISQATQSITYTPFLKASTIAEAVGSDAYLLTYTYGTDHHRAKSELQKNGNTIETRFYVGAYEEQRLPGTTNKIHYVNGPGGLCAMIVQANGTESIYYVYKDHLGSPVTLTKGQQGGSFTVEAQQNFDAWGRRRNPADWTYMNVPAPPAWLYRGYTGHEHVESFEAVYPIRTSKPKPSQQDHSAKGGWLYSPSAPMDDNMPTWAVNAPPRRSAQAFPARVPNRSCTGRKGWQKL